MAEDLQVKKRETRGKRNARKQRAAGTIPAVLYGHGEDSISLSVDATDFAGILRRGGRVVDLSGDLEEQALIKDIQWDTFGSQVLHLDFTRIAAGETITVTIAVELRGSAPGMNEGGIVEQSIHEIEIECPAVSVPDKLQVNINNLKLGESLTVADIAAPEGATLLIAEDKVVVQCVEPAPDLDEDEAAPMSVEPEVIGRKPGEEGEGE
jgi:large subunit ribosomal protein L25